MKIIAFTQKFSGVGYHRIMLPIANMQKDYAMITDVLNDEILDNNYDLLVINRMCSGYSLEQILEWRKKYGFKLVIDNDDFWNLDPTHNLFERYQKNNIPEVIKSYILAADVCTTTHERLGDEIYKLNQNVHILPNALPYGKEQFLDKKIESDKVRLFWSGSDTHLHDIKILREPLKRINQLNVQMVMSGYVESDIWNTMVFYFSNGRKLDTKIYRYNEVVRYMEAYGDSDISLIPLQDTYFSAMKSNLKVLETAAKKNPAIVSNVHPYKDLPVLYVNSQRDWYKHIKTLVSDEAMRKELGLKLFEYCDKNFNFELINKRRFDIYKYASN